MHNNLGIALARTGHEEESIASWSRPCGCAPIMSSAHEPGPVLARLGRPAAAVEHLEVALRARPHLLVAYQPLVAGYVALGRQTAATETGSVPRPRTVQGDTQLAGQISAWLAEHGSEHESR